MSCSYERVIIKFVVHKFCLMQIITISTCNSIDASRETVSSRFLISIGTPVSTPVPVELQSMEYVGRPGLPDN